jgi:NAD(P)-dependent dehydrogenase (short-subunit alcohol dehydrogenase family)
VRLFGGFDTWVNNAGVSIYGAISATSLDDQRRLFETNYWGVVNGSLVAAEHLRKRYGGGAIVNVGSILSDAPPADPGRLFRLEARGEGLHQRPCAWN